MIKSIKFIFSGSTFKASVCVFLGQPLYYQLVLNPFLLHFVVGWSGGAKVLGKLPVPGRPTYLDYSRPIALAIGAGGGCLDIFSLSCHFSFLSPSLWEAARYRLKYCLKGPLNPEQPTKYILLSFSILKTNILYYTEHILSNYWFYDPVM